VTVGANNGDKHHVVSLAQTLSGRPGSDGGRRRGIDRGGRDPL